MPQKLKDYHEGIPYHHVKKGDAPGCYQLHRPSKCRIKFPVTNRPIHLCEVPYKQKTNLIENGGTFRELIIPSTEPNFYPTVLPKSDYERLKQSAKKVSAEEQIRLIQEQEEAARAQAKASELRKRGLRERQQAQPGAGAGEGAGEGEGDAEGEEAELRGPDQAAHTLTRAQMLLGEGMPGPRLAAGVILASKCHAIRDAQLVEKEIIKKEMTDEERRLDSIMEENRQAAERRAEAEEKRRHQLNLQNLAALKEQIAAHDTAKIMEAERIEEESIRLNQANIAMQIEEARKLQDKWTRQRKLKETLDQGTSEILYFKQLQNEEERIANLRVAQFLRQKREREARQRAGLEAVKAAKLKGIAYIADAQKAEQELKEELERVRNLKIQEDVEREFRRKERDAAVKRRRDLHALHEARSNQIQDIHRMIAREIAKDEQAFNNAARQNEEYLRKAKEEDEQRKVRTEKHRQAIMKQINDKERARAELRELTRNQGVAIRLEREQQETHERTIIKQKVAEMRSQKIPEKYVAEVEQTLSHYGY